MKPGRDGQPPNRALQPTGLVVASLPLAPAAERRDVERARFRFPQASVIGFSDVQFLTIVRVTFLNGHSGGPRGLFADYGLLLASFVAVILIGARSARLRRSDIPSG